MRGEHRQYIRHAVVFSGSSPHARGTPVTVICRLSSLGIIPACAGNTREMYCETCPSWDHPRMRGEHAHDRRILAAIRGSSPHARGTLCCRFRLFGRLGIIPACAGNTYGFYYAGDVIRDHPRMRGEHADMLLSPSSSWGSSPHARGTQSDRR